MAYNPNALTATLTSTSAVSATATVAAASGINYQIVGFCGASSDQPYSVELKKGSTVLMTMQGSADTTVGYDFGVDGPVGGDNTAINCVTTPTATGNCSANIIYRKAIV